jgi:hypothetical protein
VDEGDEVTLAKAPEWRGRVTGCARRGGLSVEFVGGGHGTFREEDLRPTEGKDWPPKMETKTA